MNITDNKSSQQLLIFSITLEEPNGSDSTKMINH